MLRKGGNEVGFFLTFVEILAISTCDRRKDSFYTFVLVWLDRPDLNLMFIVVAVREREGVGTE